MSAVMVKLDLLSIQMGNEQMYSTESEMADVIAESELTSIYRQKLAYGWSRDDAQWYIDNLRRKRCTVPFSSMCQT
jgi:hypothetical protein